MFLGPDPVALAQRLEGIDGVDAIICPPYTRFAECVDAGLATFAQNVHWEPEGAYTGEISAEMLIVAGVRGSLVGHSERRLYFGETDLAVARRAHAALAAGLGVIACGGGTQGQRGGGGTELLLRGQGAAVCGGGRGGDRPLRFLPAPPARRTAPGGAPR